MVTSDGGLKLLAKTLKLTELFARIDYEIIPKNMLY